MKIYFCEQDETEIGNEGQRHLSRQLLGMALHENWPALFSLPAQGEFPAGVERTEQGKPYFPQYPQIQFNISHCRSCVACAVGSRPLGIDVERRFPWKEPLAKRICTPGEWEQLQALTDGEKEQRLQLLWSRKESYLKYTGTGIRVNLKELSVWTPEDTRCRFYEWQRERYTLTVCTEEEPEQLIQFKDGKLWIIE